MTRAKTPLAVTFALDEALVRRPVGELALPDSVYQGVTRADLADLDVFNAEGTPVPHAFCTPHVWPDLPRNNRREIVLAVVLMARARSSWLMPFPLTEVLSSRILSPICL